MTTSPQKSLCIAKDILASLLAGTSFTLLLGILQAAEIMPEASDTLLRPGPYLANKLRATGVAGLLLSVLGDGVVYGTLPFLFMRWRSYQPPHLTIRARPAVERRRAERIQLAAPVFVYGWQRDEPFAENTKTLNVSATGGLMPLAADVIPAQKLLLINAESNQEVPCRTMRSVPVGDGSHIVGFEFLKPSPNFWQSNLPAAPLAAASDAVVAPHA